MTKAEIIRLIEQIPDDEPLFLLRGSERVAPGLVNYYAGASEAIGTDPQTVAAARALAKRMQTWTGKKRR